MNTMSLVSDDLWEAIEPLLPKEPCKPKGGRPRIPDRAALAGIIFVLRTGCSWRLLPRELGCGSGTTCWRRLRDWQGAGVWEQLHIKLLNWLGDEGAVDWSRASVDSLSVRAKRGASRPGRTRLIAGSSAPNTTSSSTAMASPWRCASRRPTPTIPPNSCRWSTPSRRSSGPGADQDDRVSVRPNSTPTRPTIPRTSAAPCGLAASSRASPDAGSTHLSGWGGTDGWWSGCWPGCSAVVASAFAMSGGLISSKGCCTSPAPSSVSASSTQVPHEASSASRLRRRMLYALKR